MMPGGHYNWPRAPLLGGLEPDENDAESSSQSTTSSDSDSNSSSTFQQLRSCPNLSRTTAHANSKCRAQVKELRAASSFSGSEVLWPELSAAKLAEMDAKLGPMAFGALDADAIVEWALEIPHFEQIFLDAQTRAQVLGESLGLLAMLTKFQRADDDEQQFQEKSGCVESRLRAVLSSLGCLTRADWSRLKLLTVLMSPATATATWQLLQEAREHILNSLLTCTQQADRAAADDDTDQKHEIDVAANDDGEDGAKTATAGESRERRRAWASERPLTR